MQYKLIIFEDKTFYANALQAILSKIPQYKVVGVYDTANQVISKCQETKIDLAIVDSDIRGEKFFGVQLIKQIKSQFADTKVLGWTNYPECLQPMRDAGAEYAILKEIMDDEKHAEKFLIEALFPISDLKLKQEPPELTSQERIVLVKIAAGISETDISSQMGISHRQVRVIKDKLMAKLVASNAPNLVARAYQTRCLLPDEDLE